MEKEEVLEEIIEQIGILLNSIAPADELNKLITLELTVNPDAQDMGYDELLGHVVGKLISFYKCDKLKDLWTHYLLFEGAEAIEDLNKVS